MIFVTVGSISFDGLVQYIDEEVGRELIPSSTVIQIANGKYEPKHCEFFRTVPGLGEWYDRADLVIGHGGTGTTLEVLERGLRQISVCNPDMVDNHQDEFLDALAKRGFVRYCRRFSDMSSMIKEALASPKPESIAVTAFFKTLVCDIERFAR